MSDHNIYQRINKVMATVEYVKKDALIDGKYKAVTHDQVVSVLRKAMVEQGIVVRISQLKGKYVQFRDLSVERKMHLYVGRYAIDFVNMDAPEDLVRAVVEGHANDNGDKAPGKAMSYAVKYAMLKTFSLETGESDESRSYEAPAFTELQQDEFNTILDKENALDYAVFTRKVGPDVMLGLQKTFPSGKISQMKALCKKLEAAGWDVLREYAQQIRVATDKDDVVGLAQITSELEPDEKRVLAGILRPEDITALKSAQEI